MLETCCPTVTENTPLYWNYPDPALSQYGGEKTTVSLSSRGEHCVLNSIKILHRPLLFNTETTRMYCYPSYC